MRSHEMCLKSALALLLMCFGASSAQAWMKDWAPKFDAPPAKVHDVPKRSIRNYVVAEREEDDGRYHHCEGGYLDLNGDGIDDFVFIIPWIGSGLAGDGFDAHFIVSDGHGGRAQNVIQGFSDSGLSRADLVSANGKTYFRHSWHFGDFEKSKHNHWVYQAFSFDKNGVMKCANSDFGNKFPAVTIHYERPKFRQIDLTEADRAEITEETSPTSGRWLENAVVRAGERECPFDKNSWKFIAYTEGKVLAKFPPCKLDTAGIPPELVFESFRPRFEDCFSDFGLCTKAWKSTTSEFRVDRAKSMEETRCFSKWKKRNRAMGFIQESLVMVKSMLTFLRRKTAQFASGRFSSPSSPTGCICASIITISAACQSISTQ